MEKPKGKLIAIGGAEDKGTDLETGFIQRNNLNFFEMGILRRIVEELGAENPEIAVITTASSIPKEVGENYINAFSKIGCSKVHHLNIRTREDATKPEFLECIREANGVMFSGGNQLRLTSTFGGTEFLNIIRKRLHEENFIVAGTSAGAMAMSNTMIYEGSSSRAHLKGEVKITTGLAFMRDVIFDSHFDKRGRFGRLAQAVAANPSCIGIGLGEDTGVLITDENKLEAIGSGMVIIVDGHQISKSNIADIAEGNPISIGNLVVHFMSKGDEYFLHERTLITNQTITTNLTEE